MKLLTVSVKRLITIFSGPMVGLQLTHIAFIET